MPLAVSPEHLAVVSAQLGIEEQSLGALIAGNIPLAMPVPAAADSVSARMSALFARHTQGWGAVSVEGMATLLQGAETLVPVGAAYASSDTSGGTTVTRSGSVF